MSNKALYLDVVSDRVADKRVGMMSKVTFDNLTDAEAFAKDFARKYRVKVTVRGRTGVARFMSDGRR